MEKSQALGKAPEEQASVLNKALQPVIDEFSRYYPEIGLGYYALDLDRVVAVSPDSQTDFFRTVPHLYKYFNLYQSGHAEILQIPTSEFQGAEPMLVALTALGPHSLPPKNRAPDLDFRSATV